MPQRLPQPPGLASPHVKRNGRFWGAGLLVALVLVLALVLSRGGGAHPTLAGKSHSGAAHHHGSTGADVGQPPPRPGLGGRRPARHIRLRG